VASAGTVHYLTLEEIRQAIRELGYIPRQRNVFYELIRESGRENEPTPHYGQTLPVLQ
jgi:cyclic dehypoxanthinyl futalosine synthase